ncbi:MAG: ABC transporter substrate-binding protein, partial [Paracoccus sp.]|nr:ABC transporter substrate-binding protein [Paracoccus sp. (in: a-proteobacteria)]
MDVAAQQVGGGPAQHLLRGAVYEGRLALGIDAINLLARGVQDQLVLPLQLRKEGLGAPPFPLKKTDLSIGFVAITCATPIIMAEPMGFYSRYGLNVEVIKTAGWAVARDKSLSGEYDASHMLTPMPLAMTMGAG